MTTKQKQLILCWFNLIEPSDMDGIWGRQSEAATRKLQNRLGITIDGIFGQNTESEALNAIINGTDLPDADEDNDMPNKTGTFWDEIEYFDRSEFKCKCGGKYCNGYPAEPDERMVKIADQLRKNLGVPITIVSGLRCKMWNAIQGGVSNSQHMYGEAADIYAKGISQSRAEAELDKIGEVRYHYAIKGSNNVHFDVPKGNR